MVTRSNRQRWSDDEAVISKIGAAFATQATKLELRIPADLARIAVQAWERDDLGDASDVESSAESTTRQRAASLALIGLAITEHGRHEEAVVVVELDPWLVGDAVPAAIESAESE